MLMLAPSMTQYHVQVNTKGKERYCQDTVYTSAVETIGISTMNERPKNIKIAAILARNSSHLQVLGGYVVSKDMQKRVISSSFEMVFL